MEDYQVRVAVELNELNEKIRRLECFANGKTFDGLDEIDKGLLLAQCEAMRAYATILGLRVLRFKQAPWTTSRKSSSWSTKRGGLCQ